MAGHEPWFDFEFVEGAVPENMLASWRSVSPSQDLSLPQKNSFVPTDFTLRCDELGLEAEGGPFPSAPSLLVDEPGLRLWAKTDSSFRLPRTTAHFRLCSPTFYASARAAASTHLLLKLLEDALCETSYMAELTGLQCSCWFEGKAGLDIKVEGFSHRLPVLVAAVFRAFRELDPSPTTFARVLEALQLQYSNMNLKPHKHATYLRLLALKDTVWSPEAVLAELQTHDLDQTLQFLNQNIMSSASLHVESLTHGNVTKEESVALARDVLSLLGPAVSLPVNNRPMECAVAFPGNTSLLHRAPVKNAEEENSVVEVYRQVGPDDTRKRAILDFVEQLVQEPCYDTLRTKEQLGYSVHSGLRLTHGILGFAVVVVSGEHGPAYLDSRVRAFLEAQAEVIAKMDLKEFEMHRQAVISTKLLKVGLEDGFRYNLRYTSCN